jgi:CrcB protein
MVGLLLVGTGGFVGSVLRYLVSVWVHGILDSPWFPYGTLVVNATGSFVIGFLAGLVEARELFSLQARLFLFVGMLGGYTTFSSFALETFNLARNPQAVWAVMNIAAQLLLGLMAVWLGHLLARAVC